MIIAPFPHSEGARIRALQQLEILDTEAEDGFDALVKTAALVCGAPISLVSLVDTDRQWFKASVGLGDATQTPRDGSFCSHAILQDGLFEVPNALEDERFHDNPLVVGAPYIRLYAGAPLILTCGAYVGELCVIDSEARTLNPHQRQVLLHLARAASQLMETRRMARDAEQSAAQFQALSESSPLGIYAADPQGACTYTNGIWQQIFGLTEAQSLGTGWTATLHPADAPTVFAQWQACADSGQAFDMEFRIHQPGGALRVVHSTARQTLDKQGLRTGYVGTVQDITERKRVMDELARTNVEMRNFAYVASHDLKAPMRGIDQLAGWLAEEMEGQASPTSMEYLRLMRVRIGRLEGLLNDLLAYAQAGRVEGTPEMLDSGLMVRNVFDMCRGNKPFTLKVEGDFPTFFTTRTPLELVIRNLMNNAIKHHDAPQGELTVAVRRWHDRYEFSVADDGAGIAPEHFERVFGMFQTLRPRDEVEGSGMGLAIVKKTVESFGGTIQVAANAPRGAVFRFSWPVHTDKSA